MSNKITNRFKWSSIFLKNKIYLKDIKMYFEEKKKNSLKFIETINCKDTYNNNAKKILKPVYSNDILLYIKLLKRYLIQKGKKNFTNILEK